MEFLYKITYVDKEKEQKSWHMYSFRKFFQQGSKVRKMVQQSKIREGNLFQYSETPPSLTIQPWKTYQSSFRYNAKRTLRIYLNCHIASRKIHSGEHRLPWKPRESSEATPLRDAPSAVAQCGTRNPWWDYRGGPQSLLPVVTSGSWLLLLFPLNSLYSPMKTIFFLLYKCVAI